MTGGQLRWSARRPVAGARTATTRGLVRSSRLEPHWRLAGRRAPALAPADGLDTPPGGEFGGALGDQRLSARLVKTGAAGVVARRGDHRQRVRPRGGAGSSTSRCLAVTPGNILAPHRARTLLEGCVHPGRDGSAALGVDAACRLWPRRGSAAGRAALRFRRGRATSPALATACATSTGRRRRWRKTRVASGTDCGCSPAPGGSAGARPPCRCLAKGAPKLFAAMRAGRRGTSPTG